MDSEIRSLQARVRALKRKYAPQLAFVRLRKLAEDHVLECERARGEHKPQPDYWSLTGKIVKAGIRLRTFMAVHNYLDRCLKNDDLPEVRHILLALLPFDWERINYHMPANSGLSDLDEEARDRFWKEWLASAA